MMLSGQPYWPSVLALDSPRSMLWGDTEGTTQVHLAVAAARRRSGSHAADFLGALPVLVASADEGLLTEFGDPIMMPTCLLGIAKRGGRQTGGFGPGTACRVEVRT